MMQFRFLRDVKCCFLSIGSFQSIINVHVIIIQVEMKPILTLKRRPEKLVSHSSRVVSIPGKEKRERSLTFHVRLFCPSMFNVAEDIELKYLVP